ncbi:unnamed protein product [Ceutorhynchus assimilis]|uniref:Peptidase S1 domain-containing protein n=1 Tax=Ceutorhynchus assimilis TaxID=467358 RepID=A0A9N9MS83_9CUCU|nr:unnamed protein product [Ceutorhynchus assimilis]
MFYDATGNKWRIELTKKVFRFFQIRISFFLVSNVYSESQCRIVGGGCAKIEDYPYQLSVRILNQHLCGGALIAAGYGLSAAHCFRIINILYSVRAGSDLKEDGGTITNISKVYVHPEHNKHICDIAIMVFQNPLTSTIQPVKLPENNNILAPGIRGTVSGFGDTYFGQVIGTNILKAAQVSVIDFEWCKNQYQKLRIPIFLTEMVFCAGSDNMKNITDACQGDSGGPLVIDNVLYVSNVYSQSQCRIVGGEFVKIEDFPYQLSVRVRNRHLCGGALIAARYGLSAAHCFIEIALYSVRAGSDLKETGGTMTNISTIYIHPKRTSPYDHDYDIAILVFEYPLTFSLKIQPVKLPRNNDYPKPGINGTVSGFGDTYHSQEQGSKLLKAAQVSVTDFESCENQYQMCQSLTEMVFCAGSDNMDNSADSCHGNSGGPFVIDNVLYGIVSQGKKCDMPEYPGVYTNVAELRDFIWLNTGV